MPIVPQILSQVNASSTTISSVVVPSGANMAIVLVCWGSLYTTSPPGDSAYTATRNSQSFTSIIQATWSGSYNYGPACMPTTYYYRWRGGILYKSAPSSGTYNIAVSGLPTSTFRAVAYVIKDANFNDLTNIRSTTFVTKTSYTQTSTNTLKRGGLAFTITRPYRSGDSTNHYSTTVDTVSPTDNAGIHAFAATRAAASNTYSWSATRYGYVLNFYVEGKPLVPLFSMGQ